MAKFYAVGYDSKGQLKRIDVSDAQTRIEAENIAWSAKDLDDIEVYIVKGTEKQGETTTKNFKVRRKLRGEGKQVNYGY